MFDGSETTFAHYDASTGAHSNIDQVIQLARERASNKSTVKPQEALVEP